MMERKKVLGIRENLVSIKKMTQNQLVLHLIQKYFGKKTSENSLTGIYKKSSGFGGKKKFK